MFRNIYFLDSGLHLFYINLKTKEVISNRGVQVKQEYDLNSG